MALTTTSLSGADAPWSSQSKFVLDGPKPDGARRAAVPRAASTPNMHSAISAAIDRAFNDDGSGNIAREQIDRETMRDLAHFFRTTGPPITRDSVSMDVNQCFPLPTAADNRRWSIQSLRRAKKGSMRRPGSLQDKAVPKTTAAGHSYIAISVPTGSQGGDQRQSIHGRLPVLQRPTFPRRLLSEEGQWPQRTSSRGMQSSTRPASGGITFFVDEAPSERSSVASLAPETPAVNRTASVPAPEPTTDSEKTPATATKPSLFPSPTSPNRESIETASVEKDVPVTTPTSEPKNMFFPVVSPNRGRKSTDSGATVTSPTTAPKPLGHRRKLSAFPSTVPPKSPESPNPQRRESPKPPPRKESPNPQQRKQSPNPPQRKQSPKPPQRVESPKPSRKKTPSSLLLKSTLEVPKGAPLLPESPGFPKMLAAMTFPSPPESSPSHSANNSISSMGSGRPSMTPPFPGRMSPASPPTSNLDERMMHPTRPPLRQIKSDGGVQVSYMSQRSIATSIATYDTGSVEIHVAEAAQALQQDPTNHDASAPTHVDSQDSSTPSDGESQRESSVSTADASWQSATGSESHRYSIQSDTSVASDATTTAELYSKDRSKRESIDSTLTLSTQEFRRRRRLENRNSASFESTDKKEPLESERSETPNSLHSISSAGTNGTTQSLAERRMARKARVREKMQRDLDASKANLVGRTGRGALSEAVDSPVLGWFPQNAPATLRPAPRKSGMQTSQSAEPDTPTTPKDRSGHAARRSSVQDIAQLIPETVHETTTPVTPTAPELAFSPIMVSAVEPDSDHEDEPPVTPSLTISPIMVVASVEGPSPSSVLRPLSLLTSGATSPNSLNRASLRPEVKANLRQRALPVRVANSPLELITDRKSKRNSTPSVPTPPMSPQFVTSPRMSMPPQRHSTGTSHPKDQQRKTPQSALSPREKEAQWLMAHQRKTVDDWRMEALEERTRWERLEKKELPETIVESTDDTKVSGDDGNDTETSPESEDRTPMREEHSNSSSMTRQNSHARALRALNANAPRDTSRSSAISSTASNEANEETTPGTEPEAGGRRHTMELRLSRLEKNSDALLRGIMPLLESMNSRLGEMQGNNNVSRELSLEFLDLALATARTSADIKRQAVSWEIMEVDENEDENKI